jgi:hypothetical protein
MATRRRYTVCSARRQVEVTDFGPLGVQEHDRWFGLGRFELPTS